MARPSKLTKEQWEQVRLAVCGGISYAQVAGEFQIPEATIRKRASWEKWPVPARLEELAKEQKGKRNLTVSHKGRPAAGKAGEIMGKSLAEQGEAHALKVFQHTSKKLLRALPSLPDPQTWKDANTVDSMARRAAGLDKPTAQLAVQVSMFGPPKGAQAPMEIEIVDESPVDEE